MEEGSSLFGWLVWFIRTLRCSFLHLFPPRQSALRGLPRWFFIWFGRSDFPLNKFIIIIILIGDALSFLATLFRALDSSSFLLNVFSTYFRHAASSQVVPSASSACLTPVELRSSHMTPPPSVFSTLSHGPLNPLYKGVGSQPDLVSCHCFYSRSSPSILRFTFVEPTDRFF